MDFREFRTPADSQRFFEFGVGLARKTDDHIGCECGAIKTIPHRVDRLEKSIDRISPPHPFQHAVGTTLQGRMELRAEVFTVGGRVDEVVVDLNGLDARKPHSPRAGNSVETFKEVPEPEGSVAGTTASRINTEMTDVDPGQDNLTMARIDQPSHFGFDIHRRSAQQPRSDLGDDAIRTPQDAAVLDLDVGPLPPIEMTDASRKVDDAQSSQHVREFPFVSHNLEDARQPRHGFWVPGRVAAHHDRAGPGVVARQLPNQLPTLGIARRGNRTRVDHADVGHFPVTRFTVATRGQCFPDNLGLVLVDLATQCDQSTGRLSDRGRHGRQYSGRRIDERPILTQR